MVCLKLHYSPVLILLIIAYLIVNEEPNTFISVLFGEWISGGSPFLKKIISPFCATCCVLGHFSCVWLCNLMDCSCHAALSLDFLDKNIGVGCRALLQGVFPTQDWIHISYVSFFGRRVHYHQHHLGSPSIL